MTVVAGPRVKIADVGVLVIDDELDARATVEPVPANCRAVVPATDSAEEVARLVGTGWS